MKKSLVVDDTKASRILLTKFLEHEGYAVTTAGKGSQAISLLKTEPYDLVFLDIKMPFMSGTEVFKWMVQNGIVTPVVITTAHATVKNAVECTRMGAVAYLQKPFTMNRFRKLMAEIGPQISGREAGKDEAEPEKRDDLQAAREALEDGRWEAALSRLKQALAQDPINCEIYLLLSRAYSLGGDREYADKLFTAYNALK